MSVVSSSSEGGSTSSMSARRFRLQDPIDPNELRNATPILSASFEDAASFLHAFHADRGRAGELALVTRATLPSGTPVVVEVHWPGLPNPVFVRATTIKRRFGLLAVLHSDESHACGFLLRVAHGKPVKYHLRAHRRFCVRLPVWWRRFGSVERHPGVAEDVSTGGVLIATGSGLPIRDEHVSLRLLVPSAGQDLVIAGVVTHTRARSRDSVFGVRFEHRSGAEQRSLRRLLRVFATRGVVTLE